MHAGLEMVKNNIRREQFPSQIRREKFSAKANHEHHLKCNISDCAQMNLQKQSLRSFLKSYQPRNKEDLILELPVGVGAEKGVPDLGPHLLGNHLQSRLQGVVHLDLALLGVELDAAGAEN